MINKIIAVLIASDFLLQAGWGLIGPIFAIFLTGPLHGTIAIVGFVASTYWITKSLIQPFLAHILDSIKGEIDDFLSICAEIFGYSVDIVSCFNFVDDSAYRRNL